MRFPRAKHSMNRREEFLRTRTEGRAKRGRFLTLSTLADPSLPGLKTGFITTKRCGKAHDRNRLRRRLRALVHAHAGQLADQRRYLVTIPRPGSSTASYAELEAEWLRLARKLSLFRSEDGPA